MKLYVLRHAHSPTTSEAGVTQDALRPISDRGRQEIRRIFVEMQQRKAAPEIILCSPLMRALQTAEEAAHKFYPPLGFKPIDILANQISGQALFDQLRKALAELLPAKISSNGLEVLIVGHQPQLGEMVSHISGEVVEFRPGGIAEIEVDAQGKSSLLWSKNP